MVDVEGEGNIVTLFRAAAADKLLLATTDGRGFVTSATGAVAETRKGKQVVNLKPGARLKTVRPIGEGHDYVGVIGENRKLVVYPLAELPEMGRGQGSSSSAIATAASPTRPASLRRGLELGRDRRKRPDPVRSRHEPLARPPAARGADAAHGFPKEKPLGEGTGPPWGANPRLLRA